MSDQNIQALRAQERKHIPAVLTKDEVKLVLQNTSLEYSLLVHLKNAGGQMININMQKFCIDTKQAISTLKTIF